MICHQANNTKRTQAVIALESAWADSLKTVLKHLSYLTASACDTVSDDHELLHAALFTKWWAGLAVPAIPG